MEKQAELVFIPSPGIGHLVSTLQIAKLLSSRNTQLSITVLIMQFPAAVSDVPNPPLASLSDSDSHRINFIYLPKPDTETFPGNRMPGFVETQKPNVKAAVGNLMKTNSTTRIAGFVVDMFCTSMIDVADELNIPSYIFFTSSAASLGLLFHLQKQNDQRSVDLSEFRNSDAELAIPGFTKSLPAKVLPGRLLTKESADSFLNVVKKFRQTKGIMVNTFSALESHALHALNDARHVDILPPVYPVGPLLNLNNDDVDPDKAMQKADVMKWLDNQPESSVVFLCFGSMGSFNETQVREIAKSIEHSGKRFLWSLRQPPAATGKLAYPGEYDDVSGVLPEGFLDRTAGMGKVIGWAPQAAILSHASVGGFVSHCGWNSTLESVWGGVPVATWPMYAEQQLNAFGIVEELGVGVEVDMSYRSDAAVLVRAEEIERAIREVMEEESGVRKRVREMSEKGKRALMEGGSSYISLGSFIDQI